MTPKPLELLAPARDAETGRQAIQHGADAVYIGASGFGARKAAGNSVADIAELVTFAHQYRARVYVTVNTIVYDNELRQVERLCRELYEAGVDALIVQDMGLLEMNLPPIELHASTQCDTRTPQKARFLEDVGFSQIVLARELTLKEIEEICEAVTVPVECFVHGALCVSYSGRCHASQASCGRSANRGECAQICRLPYTLADASGKVLAKDRYLLSLKDLNASANIPEMIRAGVSSFKIEGRLKDAAYVKNITAHYRRLIDAVIEAEPERYCRSSIGKSEIGFTPDPSKSFNRGFTTYFQDSRRPRSIASILTPKSMGEEVDAKELNNGDGISWRDRDGEFTGALVNGVTPKGEVLTSDGRRLPAGTALRRTHDRLWEQKLAKPTAVRTIAVDMAIDEKGLTASDERGCLVRLPLDCTLDKALKPFDPEPTLSKLGNTIYRIRTFENRLPKDVFIPASSLTQLRRRVTEALDRANEATYPFNYRHKENPDARYPSVRLSFADNVSNRLATDFYRRHGVREIEPAMECRAPWSDRVPRSDKTPQSDKVLRSDVVMTTRHCILRELGMCLKEKGRPRPRLPLTLFSGKYRFTAVPDCDRCEMKIIK